jgi:hypothetical protein
MAAATVEVEMEVLEVSEATATSLLTISMWMTITEPTHISLHRSLRLFLVEWVSEVISVIEPHHHGIQISLVFGRLLKPHHLVASCIYHMTSWQKQGCSI